MRTAERAALVLCGCLALPALARAATERVHWQCEVAYLPQRSTWVRDVAWIVQADGARSAPVLQALHIDGQPVHAFSLDEERLLTSMDNERIVIDLDRRLWQSDFRGQATGQGRCEPADAQH